MINPPLNKSPTLTRSLTRTITQEEKKDIKDLRDSAKPMVCECRQNTLTPATEILFSIMEDPVMEGKGGGMVVNVRDGGSKRRKKTKRRKTKKKKKKKKETKRRKTKRKTNKGRNTKRR
jgi:hypothetical protein